jgi:hypothetical protein
MACPLILLLPPEGLHFLNVLDIVVNIVLIVSTALPTHAGSVSPPDEDRRVIRTAAVHVQEIRPYHPCTAAADVSSALAWCDDDDDQSRLESIVVTDRQ